MIVLLSILGALNAPLASTGPNALPASTITLPPASAGSPASVVDAQIAAYNSGDVETFAACYADDVEFYDLGPGNPITMRGKAALIAQYKPILDRYRPRARLINRIVDGRFVIDKEQILAGEHSNSGAAIYEVVDGKIARVWFTPAVLRLLPR